MRSYAPSVLHLLHTFTRPTIAMARDRDALEHLSLNFWPSTGNGRITQLL